MGTLSYIARRLGLGCITLLGITIVTFCLIALAPGDPAALVADEFLPPDKAEKMVMEIRKQFDLDKPVLVRYGLWLRKLATGDLGVSIGDRRPVGEKILDAAAPTLVVNLAAMFLALGLSLPLGLAAAARQGSLFDRATGLILYALYSIPSFIGAIVLILFVGVKWDLLPFRGIRSDNFAELTALGQAWDIAMHMVLYVLCSTYASLAFYSRFVKTNLLEVVRQDYIRTARAKGLSEATVLVRHAFRNTLIPLVTLIGLTLPFVLSGAVILEVIFTWPGMGRLFWTAVYERDFPVVMALETATAVLVLAFTLAVDLLYGVIDPRVSHG